MIQKSFVIFLLCLSLLLLFGCGKGPLDPGTETHGTESGTESESSSESAAPNLSCPIGIRLEEASGTCTVHISVTGETDLGALDAKLIYPEGKMTFVKLLQSSENGRTLAAASEKDGTVKISFASAGTVSSGETFISLEFTKTGDIAVSDLELRVTTCVGHDLRELEAQITRAS